jgi:hypothetical protein
MCIISSGSIEGRLAVVRLKMRPQPGQIDEAVDLAQQVTIRDMSLEAEAVKQRLLHHPPPAHQRPNLLPTNRESTLDPTIKQSFSTSGNGRGLFRIGR